MLILYTSNVTLPTPQEGGLRMHIGSIMNPALYITLTAKVWTKPPDLVVYPPIATKATAAQREQL